MCVYVNFLFETKNGENASLREFIYCFLAKMCCFFASFSLIIIDVVDVCCSHIRFWVRAFQMQIGISFVLLFLPIASNRKNISLKPYIVNIEMIKCADFVASPYKSKNQ